MSTSIHDLLETITDIAASVRGGDEAIADAAVRAIGHLGRGIDHLEVTDGDLDRDASQRSLVVADLTAASHRVARQWSSGADRLDTIAAVVADVIAARSTRLDQGESWAAAVELAHVVACCADVATRFPPYAGAPSLGRVLRLTRHVEQLARRDPPDAQAAAWLDHPIAVEREMSGHPRHDAQQPVVETAAGLLIALEREARDGTLHLYSVLAACVAAQTCADTAGTLIHRDGSLAPVRQRNIPAADGWRVLQAALIRFDDGSRLHHAPPSQVTSRALALHRGVVQLPAESPSTTEALTFIANRLPMTADLIEDTLRGWARTGHLFARARDLPAGEDRVRAVLRDRAVIATPMDLAPVLLSARIAARVSSELALTLHRQLGEPGRDRHLIAALAAGTRPGLQDRDSRYVQRLAARLDQSSFSLPTLTR